MRGLHPFYYPYENGSYSAWQSYGVAESFMGSFFGLICMDMFLLLSLLVIFYVSDCVSSRALMLIFSAGGIPASSVEGRSVDNVLIVHRASISGLPSIHT